MSSRDPAALRILVLRENWLGNTGLSGQDALMSLGSLVDSVAEGDYLPSVGRSMTIRLARRALTPLLIREYNEAIVRAAHRLRPHLVVTFKGPHVEPSTLQRIRALGSRLFCFYPDVSYFEHGARIPHALPLYDWVFSTKSFGPSDLSKHFGISNASFLPHAFDRRVHRPHVPTPELMNLFGADVSFIGAWSPKKEAVLEAYHVSRPAVNLKIWGNGWERLREGSSLRRCTTFIPVTGLAYSAAISCSKVNLAILFEGPASAGKGDLITSRTFHIPASGGLMLHERTPDLLRFFEEGQEVVCFSSPEEMTSQIDWLLANETDRLRIAAAGRGIVMGNHSWEHRAQVILDRYFDLRDSTTAAS